ncbi:MAG: carbamoyltransferase HypF [Blastocatellia bacterium]|nr:carbamoyltransferase HypF [Blastocatellia bacterium]
MNNLEKRFALTIRGRVQGVGFRPFVYRLAQQLSLTGWVSNSLQGVLIEIQGKEIDLEKFFTLLEQDSPPNSEISSIEKHALPLKTEENFLIAQSNLAGIKESAILPDLATCQECLAEIFDINNRRYFYPFTNCVNCGPRFSIIENLPYDRSNTTMKDFLMCQECEKEYSDPSNRRFHAQPNACHTCGPQLAFYDSNNLLATKIEAITLAVTLIKEGKIIAIKSTGGFLLIVDASNKEAIAKLRQRKNREEKPFALLYPSLDLVKKHCWLSDVESNSLTSAIAPIVLLKQLDGINIADNVAPNSNYLGIMLANNPLQHLLMYLLEAPVVATSGNISDEPICIDEKEAISYLGSIADGFLVHNRAIVQAIDDSIVQVVLGKEMLLRRARGYSSLITEFTNCSSGILALGAQLKNTVAFSLENGIYLSQHLGDLHNKKAFANFKQTITKINKVYDNKISNIVHDLHPEYLSTKYVQSQSLNSLAVQHHYAHALACMAENQLTGNVFAVVWDGSGYGTDGTIWGGEFLQITSNKFSRFAHLKQFPLIGSEKAIKEPRRVALALLYEVLGEEIFNSQLTCIQSFTEQELKILKQMLKNKINAPLTSSVGRLFDGVASILAIEQKCSFEAQAAIKMENLASKVDTKESYKFIICKKQSPIIIDWKEFIANILSDLSNLIDIKLISAKFHNALVNMLVEIAKLVGEKQVVLSGGCFQNRYLLEKSVLALVQAGFSVYWQQKLPSNDGSIAIGQIVAASRVKS